MGKTRALRRSACRRPCLPQGRGRPGERTRSCSPNLPEAINWGSDAPAALSLCLPASDGSRRNAPALRVCVAKPWVPQPHCPKRQATWRALRPPPGCCGAGGNQNNPGSACPQSPAGGSEARPGDTQGHLPRWGAREPAQRSEGTEAGPGLVPGGVRSAGPGCGGPGASVRPSARGGPACPGNPAPTGSVSSLPAPPSVLTLLPGGTRHPRNPGPAPQRPLPRI